MSSLDAFTWVEEAGVAPLDGPGTWFALVRVCKPDEAHGDTDLHRTFDDLDVALAWVAEKVALVLDRDRPEGWALNERDPGEHPRPGDKARSKRGGREVSIIRMKWHLRSTDVSYITVRGFGSGHERTVVHAEWLAYSYRDHERGALP